MKRLALLIALTAMFCMVADADAYRNGNGKFALHFAGTHNEKAGCTDQDATLAGDCHNIVDSSSDNPGRFDVYVLAIDVVDITAARYGLACDGAFYFYGWTNCAGLELPSPGWPNCNEGNAQEFGGVGQPGPIVVLGILDLYTYSSSVSISTAEDPRVGFAEFCDDTQPNPLCDTTTNPLSFNTLGFNGNSGVNNCEIIPTEHRSWGRVKALYR